MTAITFFPFTRVSPEDIRTLGGFFEGVKGLSLSRKRDLENRDPDMFDPVYLPEEELRDLDASVASYQSWAQMHKGNERNLKNLIKASPYFKTETDLTSIQSQIRGGQSAGDGDPEPFNPLVFLKFAEILDHEHQAIDEQLSALDEGKSTLLAELKGEMEPEETPEPGDLPKYDPGETMPGTRICAWAELARKTGLLANEPNILVTTSQGIMDYLTANADEVINELDIQAVKVHENGCANQAGWFRDIEKILDHIIAGKQPLNVEKLNESPGCCSGSGRMKICTFPGGELNRELKIPGQQTSVCLVQLNS